MSPIIDRPIIVLTDPPAPPEALARLFVARRARVTLNLAAVIVELAGLGREARQ